MCNVFQSKYLRELHIHKKFQDIPRWGIFFFRQKTIIYNKDKYVFKAVKQFKLDTKHPCRKLREHGVQTVPDDFGTGYSSLNMIRTMPVGPVKINQTFTNDVAMDEYAHLSTRLIAMLGQELVKRYKRDASTFRMQLVNWIYYEHEDRRESNGYK